MGEQTAVSRRKDRRGRIGQIGEDFAADYVTGLGWKILDRNWRTRYGELDLIASHGSTLIIVEVKTRMSRTYDDPAAAVTPQKLQKMRLVARQWLAKQAEANERSEKNKWWEVVRFDIISIRLDYADPEDQQGASLRHHAGIVE